MTARLPWVRTFSTERLHTCLRPAHSRAELGLETANGEPGTSAVWTSRVLRRMPTASEGPQGRLPLAGEQLRPTESEQFPHLQKSHS